MARQIQVQKRNVPLEQIIAVKGQNPYATGIESLGNVLGQVLTRKAELQREGQQLAQMQQADIDKFNREANLKRELVQMKQEEVPMGRGGPNGYFVPRGVDPNSGKPLYSSSKRPGLFYDDMTPYQGTAPGKLILQTLPSEQIEQESKMDTLSLALQKVQDSYSDDFVGPVASKVGKAKQYIEPLANEQAANFYSNLADMRNQIVYLRSGKQINEEEYKRLLNAIPNENTSATDFKVRLGNFQQLKDTILSSRQRNLSGTGYRTPNGLNSIESPKPRTITPRKAGRFIIEEE